MERKTTEVQSENTIHLEYERPTSNNRLYSAVVDFFIAVIVILLLVFCTNEITKTTDFYKSNIGVIDDIKLSSKLYDYDASDKLTEVTNLMLIEGDATAWQIVNKASTVIEGDKSPNANEKQRTGFLYFCFVEELKNPAELKDFYKMHADAYEKERIEALNTRNNKNLFEYVYDDEGNIKTEPGIITYRTTVNGEIIYTPEKVNESSIMYQSEPIKVIRRTANGSAQDFLDYFYRPFISRLPNSLVMIPRYYEATYSLSNTMLYILIPTPVVLGIILTYYVPGLFFRRGRKSIGKLLFKIGIIDKTNFSPSFWRYTLRSLIIAAECVFFIPAVVSLTMMIFSKTNTTIHDKILKMNLVYTKETKVYLDGLDVLVGVQNPSKKPVEFERIDELR